MLKLFEEFQVTNVESSKKKRDTFVLFMALHVTFETSLTGNAVINS